MSAAEPIDLTAAQAARAIAAGELKAEELLAAYHARARADRLNCFTWLPPEPPRVAERSRAVESSPGAEPSRVAERSRAVESSPGAAPSRGAEPSRAAAPSRARVGDRSDHAGGSSSDTPLCGVPLAVKDLFCTEGVPSQSGSKILEGYLPPYTATVVQRLRDAGAVLLGKTNQDEFAMGSSNENSAYGPVLNPWDPGRVPGGSSGGSAAAVAAGLAPWALGTDTGGSIRQPAALCGIVGLKPTYGAVSRYGMIAFASSLDQAGPLTRDVADAALLLGQMVGARDRRDATSLDFPEPIAAPSAERLDGIRLGVPDELTGDGIEAGVRAAFEAALRRAEELGARVDRVRLPHAPHGLAAYYIIAPAECSSNLARFDGVRYGLRAGGERDLVGMYTQTRHDGFGEEVRRRVMLGTYALSAGYYEAYYGRAQRVRTKIVEDFRAAFAQVDFVVTPTAPTVAFELGEKTRDPWAMYLNDFCTVPMSLAGIPAISIPCGLAGSERGLGPGGAGLPVGLQLAGPAFSENRLLDAAFALERALAFDGSPARATRPGAVAGGQANEARLDGRGIDAKGGV